MTKKKVTIKEAVRVVGHLLETNGTTNVFARTRSGNDCNWSSPKACKFCLQGAIDLVSLKVLGNDIHDGQLDKAVDRVINSPETLITAWDGTDEEGRKEIVRKLKEA